MLELVIVIVVGLVVWRGIRSMLRRKSRGGLKCKDCRYLVKAFDDGVRCGYGGGDVFKTPVHVANCMDWEKR